MNNIVKLRNAIKKKQPIFRRQSSPKKIEVGTGWRKAKGCDSKVGSNRKGYLKKVKIGYKGPREARGLSREGLNIVLVNNLNELSKVDAKKDIVCIGKIGNRKRIMLLEECIKNKIKILNIRDPQKFITDTKEKRQKDKEEKTKKEAEAKEEIKKNKENIEQKVDSEEQKKKDKEEKDKLLTKREI